MNNEKISVELELITEKFTSKIKETTSKIKELGNDIKEALPIGKGFDLKRATQDLEDMQNKMKKATNPKVIKEYKTTIEAIKKDIEEYNKKSQNMAKMTGKISDGFKNGIKNIKKFALSLFGVRAVFGAVSKAASSYLSMDTELSAKVQSVWQGLGAQLAPIIEWLVGLFSKFLSIVNQVVKALTGIDMVARANAKSLNSQAKAGKEASKSLSGFDEITNLDTSSSSGADTSGLISLEPVDLSPLEKMKEFLQPLLDLISKIGDSFKKWTMSESFQTALDRVKTFISDIWQGLKVLFVWIIDMYSKYFAPVFDELLYFISDLITAIGDIWNAIKPVISKIWEGFKGNIEPIIEMLSIAIKGIITALRGVLQFISGVFTGDFKKAWEGIKLIFTGIWEGIWSVLKYVLNLMIGGLEKMANGAIRAINAMFKPLRSVGNSILKAVGITGFSFNELSQISIPRLNVGTNYVPSDQLAMIHEGEAVIPKKFNDREYFGAGNDELIAKLDLVIDAINDKDLNTYLDGKVIGKTAQNYINNQSRIMGRSVI